MGEGRWWGNTWWEKWVKMSKPRILHFWLKYIASPQDTDCRLRLTREICFTEWDSRWWYFGEWGAGSWIRTHNMGKEKSRWDASLMGHSLNHLTSQIPQVGEIEGPFLALGVPKSNEKEHGSPTTYKIKVCLNLLLNSKQGSTKGCVWNTELSASLFRLLGLQMGKLRPCRQKEAGRGLIWWLPNEPSSLSPW